MDDNAARQRRNAEFANDVVLQDTERRENVLERHTTDHRHFAHRSEEHTSELQSLMRISYAVFCLKKKKNKLTNSYIQHTSSIFAVYLAYVTLIHYIERRLSV